ncbi:prolipoprotein diacylglyceryl transferase [Bifidobacterium pullorum subsp. saeculare]|uniref:Phosphatidylglycerol--prolipoprotein diacylglyceryl transferase n=1 Tax=Bifidobacterium pullorum subsp. saeculare TaxID=78257 RepID=A0A938WW02_9BIFI|nr:prolipoprotein diacylglyceryl transferase [Bifidobacterium pullorum]MBM6699279.1 prolipoprotein diacylglyceryl transferase [Bifidobacterium pullorum subsp. saeculare]
MNLAYYIPSPTFSKFQIGPVTIHMYAICILAGICLAVWILTTRWKRMGGTFDQVFDTTLVTVPCALVGARLYHCITTPSQYFPPTGDPVNILKVWEGGMAIFGGVGVGALAAFLWCRHRRYPYALLADCLAPGLMVAQAVGRLGNWFNQELYGKPTTLPWGLKLNDADAIGKTEICYDGAACPDPATTLFHPTFLYEALWNLAGAAAIVWIGHRLAARLKAGQQFAMYLMWYGLGRTWVENLRINYSTEILGVRTNVWTAVIVFALGAVLFVTLHRVGQDTGELAKRLVAVSADEQERLRQEEERAAERKAAKAK